MKLRGIAVVVALLALLAPAMAQETKGSPVPAEKSVELVLYMLIGTPQASQPDNVPKELEGVVSQLRGLFTYKGFQTLDTIILRGREGRGSTARGAAALPGGPTDSSDYFASVSRFSVTQGDRGNLVRIDNLNLSVRVPYRSLTAVTGPDGKGGTVEKQPAGSWTYRNIGFETNLDVREGQKVVVGKANIDGTKNAMILVVTAKVMD